MQLHKLHSLRRSFLHFHFISAVHIWFILYIINTHFFHGNIWTHSWPAPNVSGFIAQLVEHRTGNREVTGSNPVEVLNVFSGFFTQLHKLRSLRRSFLYFHFISAVHIWFISYIINKVNIYWNYHSDADECLNNSHNCSENATCTNTEGSFNCSCKPGYIGNGHNCSGWFLKFLSRLPLVLRLLVQYEKG